MEINQNGLTVKGTRILTGEDALLKRIIINDIYDVLVAEGFSEIMIPVLQYETTFAGKVGEENNNMMYNFTDRGGRALCLAPEYTAIVQKLAATTYKRHKDVKLFYIVECFRGEKPQAGRYRQFTQIGVEILNPSIDYTQYLQALAIHLLDFEAADMNEAGIQLNVNVTRGLDYYEEGKGFEITAEILGAQKQICGGGAYENGIGFAIGIDRVLLIEQKLLNIEAPK